MQALGTFIEEADFPARFEKPDWGSLRELAEGRVRANKTAPRRVLG
jgi:hypothetical protein